MIKCNDQSDQKLYRRICLTYFALHAFDFISSTAETILGRHSTMEIRSIHLGGMFHAEEEIQMTSTMANFVGQLQGFVYNGNR